MILSETTQTMNSTSFEKRKIKFLLLEAVHKSAIDTLNKAGYENIECLKGSLEEEELLQRISDVHFLGIRSRTQLTEKVFQAVSEKLAKYSDNGSSFASVNFPEVALPAHPGKHRLLHIHKNVPGVLTEINRIFSETGINISSQYLQTNEEVGYVVIDIDVQYSEIALTRLNQVTGTIRSRVLF